MYSKKSLLDSLLCPISILNAKIRNYEDFNTSPETPRILPTSWPMPGGPRCRELSALRGKLMLIFDSFKVWKRLPFPS